MKTTQAILLLLFFCACNEVQKPTQKQQPPSTKETTTSTTKPAKEEFKNLDFTTFNKKIATVEGTPRQLMKLYYPAEASGEGNEKVTISQRNLADGQVEVTMIHDNFLDDSQRGKKIVMLLKKEATRWTVLSLKENWRCWARRGHEYWGIELCI